MGTISIDPWEGEVASLPLDSVVPNPFQPRRDFKEEEIRELAASISANGLLQPVLVRSAPAPEQWELVAGERRFRAVTRLGWGEVPAIVRDVDDETMLVLALVENLQRRNLGALEEAEGYRVLVDKFKRTQEDIALAVGKSRAAVTNILRLLKLPVEVRQLLGEEKAHAGTRTDAPLRRRPGLGCRAGSNGGRRRLVGPQARGYRAHQADAPGPQ